MPNFTDSSSLSSTSSFLSPLPSSSDPSSSVPPVSSFSSSSELASNYRIHTTILTLPNLKPFKLATTSRLLDPSKRICQYEVPGGGVCRDEGCEDVHLSRIAGHDGKGGLEPSGT